MLALSLLFAAALAAADPCQPADAHLSVVQDFGGRDAAIADIQKEGFWPMTFRDRPGTTFRAHCHRHDERLYMIEGSMILEDVRSGRVHRLEPGDKLVVPKGAIHRGETTEGALYLMGLGEIEPFDRYFIWVDPEPGDPDGGR